MTTYSDEVAITNSATVDAESAQSSLAVNPGATIIKITVLSLTVGNTYGVRIDFPGCPTPQKYLIPSNGAAASNGGKVVASWDIDVRLPVQAGISNVLISTFADVASATCKVGLKWVAN